MIVCDLTQKVKNNINNDFTSVLVDQELEGLTDTEVKSLLTDVVKKYSDVNDVAEYIYDLAVSRKINNDNVFYSSLEQIEDLLGKKANPEKPTKLENNSDEQLTDEGQDYMRRVSLVNNDYLTKAFGIATDVKEWVEKETSVSFVNAMIVDRSGRTGVVTNSTKLNENIKIYQQQLLSDVILYLADKHNGLKDVPGRMYNAKTGEYTGVLEKLKAKGYLDELSPNEMCKDGGYAIQDMYRNRDNNPQDFAKLKAYKSLLMLTHFDSALFDRFKKSLTCNKVGDMLFSADKVYTFATKGANKATTWRTTDAIPEEELDNIVNMIITTTPKYINGNLVPETYLSTSEFISAITSIKDLVFGLDDYNLDKLKEIKKQSSYSLFDNLSQQTKQTIDGKTFHQVVNSIRINPQKYLPAVIELLNSGYIRSELKVSKRLKPIQDIITSLHHGLFSSKLNTSLYALNQKDMSTNYYSYISQAADSLFKNKFLQYEIDESGKVNIIHMEDGTLSGIRNRIRQSIRVRNSKGSATYENRERTIVHRDGDDSMTFKIGGRYEVTVTRGNVMYNLLEIPRELKLNFINEILGQNITEDTLKKYTGSNDAIGDLFKFSARIFFNQYLSKLESPITKEDLLSRANDVGLKINYQLGELDVISEQDYPILTNLAIMMATVNNQLSESQIKGAEGNAMSNSTLSRLLGSFSSQWSLQNKMYDSATESIMLINNPKLFKGVYTMKESFTDDAVKDHTDWNLNEFCTALFVYDYLDGIFGEGDVIGKNVIALLPTVNSDKNTIGRILIDLKETYKTLDGTEKRLIDFTNDELIDLINSELGKVYQGTYNNIESDLIRLYAYIANNANKFTNDPEIANQLKEIVTFRDQTAKEFVDVNNLCARLNLNPVDLIKKASKLYNSEYRHAPVHLIDEVHFMKTKNEFGVTQLGANQTFKSYLYRFSPDFLINRGSDVFELNEKYTSSDNFWKHKEAEILSTLTKSKFSLVLNDSLNKATQNKMKEWFKLNPEWIDESTGEMILGKYKINEREFSIKSSEDIKELQDYLLEIADQLPDEVRKRIDKRYDAKYEFYRPYEVRKDLDINNDIHVLSDLVNMGFAEMQLNNHIAKYNLFDYLFTQEFIISTVGSCIAHPSKMKGKFTVLEEEAARFAAQHKRNVSYTAAMHEFLLNLLDGIANVYNIAVIDDIKDTLYNVTGDTDPGVKPYDGATFVNPFVVILENNSLGSAKAGITKKQFVHYYDHRTGTGGIIKTCGFGLTNDWIRNSIMLQKMMKKMTNHQWRDKNGNILNNVDINTDYNGNRIDFEKPVIFKRNGRYWRVTEFKNIGNNQYQIMGHMVNVKDLHSGKLKAQQSGETNIDENISYLFEDSENTPWERRTELNYDAEKGAVTIDTNYKLWQALGGANTVDKSLVGSKFILNPSNSSVENVVKFINNIGLKSSETVLTLEDVWLPLKYSDIHYVATAGAVKQGAANINSNKLYSNDEAYDFMQVRMNQAGIQLDKEHHADNAELSLMTQVISACTHFGYSAADAMNIYHGLRVLTDSQTSDLLKPFKKYFSNLDNIDAKQEFTASVVNAVVQELAKQSTDEKNLISVLAKDLLEKAESGKKLKFKDIKGQLPIDNQAVYGKFVSQLGSLLTKTGIKAKIPGVLAVLTPSHEIIKLYPTEVRDQLNNVISTYNDKHGRIMPVEGKFEAIEDNVDNISAPEYLDKIQAILDSMPIFLSGLTGYDRNRILCGRKYKVVVNPAFEISNVQVLPDGTQIIDVVTPTDLNNLQRLINEGAFEQVSLYVKDGRNLSAYNVRFKGTDGEYYQLYNLDSTQALFALKDLLDSDDYKALDEVNKINTLWDFAESYRHVFNDYQFDSTDSKTFASQIETFARREVRKDNATLSKNGAKFFSDRPVYINGNEVFVDRDSIEIDASEIVLPKSAKSAYGLDEFDDLASIVHNPDYFSNKILKSLGKSINDKLFTIELKKLNGNHFYIIDKNAQHYVSMDELTELDFIPFKEGDKVCKVNINNETEYELASDKDKIYLDSDGNEIVLTDDIDFYLNNLSYVAMRVSTEVDDGYLTVLSADNLAKSKNKTARVYGKFLSNSKNPGAVNKVLKGDLVAKSKNRNISIINNAIEEGREIWTSFMHLLNVVASRTPSQSMQSFMPMKIVAFENADINTAYVSTLQIWLLGSKILIGSKSCELRENPLSFNY